MIQRTSCMVGGKELSFETGKLARQANGSVFVSFGNTRVLVTACAGKKPKEDISFLPLSVEYAEKFYASGKIPGGFFRREGRPTEIATLSARMIDRPIRPLFPKNYRYETQIVASILSYDPDADPNMAAIAGTAAALHISDIPFQGPVAGCRIIHHDGAFIVAPNLEVLKDEKTDLELFVAGTQHGITMVEGGAKEVSEEKVLEGILKAQQEIIGICKAIEALHEKSNKVKIVVPEKIYDETLQKTVADFCDQKLSVVLSARGKQERYELLRSLKKELEEQILEKADAPEEGKLQVKDALDLFEQGYAKSMRQMIFQEKKRVDGRGLKTIRPISVEVGLLPCAHGSALFTRGETQVLATITLGTSEDEQIIDTLYEKGFQKCMLHYNFPPFSVGEVGRMGGQSRREIGHGALAKRSVAPMLPSYDSFPYTIRVVCDTLESNGSSSMGSVCSASMALMDTGVPMKKPVAGIAMGLIEEDNQICILSDILGDEDHLGDMDFKVAGTPEGVTGIQMDIKIDRVDAEILKRALAQAREGRLFILNEMSKAIEKSREKLSAHAPKITTLQIPRSKIALVIGPQGKMIREIIAETQAKINIEEDGTVRVAAIDEESSQKAIQKIQSLIEEAELGKVYEGTVRKIVDFGAFVNILPQQDGLLHISEIAHEHVRVVEDYLKEGEKIEVKVIGIDPSGKIKLSRKALLPGGRENSDEDRGESRGDRPYRGRSRPPYGRGGGRRS